LRLAHHVIAVSEAARKDMVRRGMPRAKISTVLNGTIGSVRSTPSPEPVPVLKRPAVLSVAGMYAHKGIADLLEAVVPLRELVPGATVYLAGDGPGRGAFEALARQLGVEDAVVFLGYSPDPAGLMRQADVLVVASRDEAFGLVIPEARAIGLPVVATNVGGIPEALDGGTAGLLVPPRAPLLLAQATARVLQDRTLHGQLVQAGSRNLERLHVRRMCAETVAVYHRVLAEHQPRRSLLGFHAKTGRVNS
jgi:glycosyltransferase involved in cell wall biosynthesis